MSEFEPCPVTGQRPSWSDKLRRFYYACPVTETVLSSVWDSKYGAVAWWRDEYLPCARKYAELHSQKPVEFQVGDVVGPTLEYLERRIKSGRNPTGHVDAVIQEISFGAATLNRYFFVGLDTPIDARCLRLISRPKKLTLADFPAGLGVHQAVQSKEFSFRININGQIHEFVGSTEHEAVQTGLDFLEVIWAAKPETKP